MTDNTTNPQELPLPKEQEDIDVEISKALHSLGEKLKDRSEVAQKEDMSHRDLSFWLNAYVPYGLLRSTERQEKLIKNMQKDSKAMTSLTRWVMILTVAVLVVAVIQAIQVCGK